MGSMSEQSAAPTLQVSGLRKYFGAVHAVNGVDLTIERGQTVALLGPNGAGKSTTVDLLLGLTQPDSGTVQVLGRTPSEATAAGQVGAMLQSGGVITELTVRELVRLVAALYPHPMEVDEVLERARIADLADRRAGKLSGGQVQRVRFALAMAPDPELLVLDEPTVAMDVETRRAFWDGMRAFAAEGRTVLFATHYLQEADDYADRVVLMANGRVVADGSTTEIKATVGGRVVRATLTGVTPADLERLPGVTTAEVRGDTVTLRCSDSDLALRALLGNYDDARHLEVSGADLESAFVALTADHEEGAR